MKQPFLVGRRLYLRPLMIEDLDGNYLSWLNSAEVSRGNLHHRFPYSRSEGEAFLRTCWSSRDRLVLAVVARPRDVHIGNIALQNINAISQSADFAVLIGDQKCWGRGYANEAARLLVQHGFDSLNLRRIACGTLATNVGMRRLAKALGFHEEGLRRQALFKDGEFVDVVEYGLLREEFDGKLVQERTSG